MDIDVVVAVFCDRPERPGRIFGTEKGYGPYKGYWEFPGGKVKPGESPEEALRREIREELEVDMEILGLYRRAVHDYPEYRVRLSLYWARPLGEMTLVEASQGRWLTGEELNPSAWLEGTCPIIEELKEMMGKEITGPGSGPGENEDPSQKH